MNIKYYLYKMKDDRTALFTIYNPFHCFLNRKWTIYRKSLLTNKTKIQIFPSWRVWFYFRCKVGNIIHEEVELW